MPSPMQSELLDLAANNAEAGFRLDYLEIYNWGTFDKNVWRIDPKKENALLTGDIGSGKSTLVDAITTLLVPHHRIVYNKAAGAESKERNLYSYIRGEYKNEKDDFTQSTKAVSLRNESNYSVLLGYFYNVGFSHGVTLAQAFWLKEGVRNPEKFFVVAQKPLSITQHFCHFDKDIATLKKQLKQTEHIEVFDQFKDYGSRFRQLFGIQSDQALDLFYQTVSMKSVGNLTDFVRSHMLEKTDTELRIQELRHHFDNLNRAHEAILKAKHQIELLKPLQHDIKDYVHVEILIQETKQCRDALLPYFAKEQVALLQTFIKEIAETITKYQQKIQHIKLTLEDLYSQEEVTRKSIDDNGGQRLHTIDQDIIRFNQDMERKKKIAQRYQELSQKLNFSPSFNESDFYHHLEKAKASLDRIEQSNKELQLKQVDLRIEIKNIEKQQQELVTELDSLKQRENNIPAQMLLLRDNIATALNVNENALPYVGELLQVVEKEKEWEGAIERVLHNFGLSLLVPEELYSQVNHYVEKTQLKGRLIYYRIKGVKYSASFSGHENNSMLNKLQIKHDTKFSHWLENELATRFNYNCSKDPEEFRRLPQAITPNGLIKSKGQRHEKDDRHNIHDRSRYILGWSNKQKIIALKADYETLQSKGQKLIKNLGEIASHLDNNRIQRDHCRDLISFTNFDDIHWQLLADKIQTLLDEKKQIEKSSDILATLRSQLEKIKLLIIDRRNELDLLSQHLGGAQQKNNDRLEELDKFKTIAETSIDSALMNQLNEYKKLTLENLNISLLGLNNIQLCQNHTLKLIEKSLDLHDHRYKSLIKSITKQMQAFKNAYPTETLDIDVSPEASSEYLRLLTVLENEDLPRHEIRFKESLNEGTINSIALFQNQLTKEKQDIEERIRKINLSLREIEYNAGTYIKLLMDPSHDADIRDFQHDLRRCLQNTLNNNHFYDEEKFLQVKAIIERFNGREGRIDIDKRWTQKVCDVRNWFNFSASERWLEDETEKEFYSDSSGKSGGQKEKLAYTILASALAYQFGLEWGVTHSRSFRFVVIDEAFGKGSNESTRYALKLFKKMNLQLLIVTPLQKIHVIEDYVRSIHFIENLTGCNSVIRNLTIEEYRLEKEKHKEQQHDIVNTH